MKPVKITPSLVALVVVNLVPLVGVFTLGWDAGAIVVVYWAENLVVGFYTVLRFVFLKMEEPAQNLAKLFLIPFFCVHFGGFCAIHGAFLAFFFRLGGDRIFSSDVGSGLPEPVQMLLSPFVHIWQNRPPGTEWALVGLLVSHGISFVRNYLQRGEYRSLRIDQVMIRPYGRIVFMHVAIIAAGLPVMLLGSPVPLLVVLIALKIAVDAVLHNRSHSNVGEGGGMEWLIGRLRVWAQSKNVARQ
jgi:hypothetical protein